MAAGFRSLALIGVGGASVPAASLSGAATDTAAATGSLNTQIKLGGAATDTATATGNLGKAAFRSLALIGIGLASPKAGAQFAGGAFAASSATGDLNKGGFRSPLLLGNVDPWVLKARVAAIDLVNPAQLAGAAIDQAAAGGSLSTQIPLGGIAQGNAAASGYLDTGAGTNLLGNARGQAAAAGDLTTQIRMVGNAMDAAKATGGLTGGTVALRVNKRYRTVARPRNYISRA